jgi:hypothetical protein
MVCEAQDLPAHIPGCSQVASQGMQDLRPNLPLFNLALAARYRSNRCVAVHAAELNKAQVLEMARNVGTSFARREPMARHLRPPSEPFAGLMQRVCHVDPFGAAEFGPWSRSI